jgi:LacI family transcriptional regulator
MGEWEIMAVRMKDIAEDLGVSVVTVSKVLRNHADISAETRARVLKRMKELNYQPNLAARGLVTGKSYIMGLVVPDLVHPFFAQVAKKMSYVLRDHGYSLVTSSSNGEAEIEQQEIERMLARRVDALFVASTQWSVETLRPSIEQQRTPYILIDRKFTGLTANFVGVDDEAVGAIATEHLIDIGCRHIAHIGGPEVSTAIGRVEGFRRAMTRHGREVPLGSIIRGEQGDDASDLFGHQAMQQMLQRQPIPDGVFCFNDLVAMGAMRAILDAGLRVPEDIAVVGCGNAFYSDFLRVPLTSVDQNSDAIGEHAVNLAVSLIGATTPVRPESILLQPTLVVRASSLRH